VTKLRRGFERSLSGGRALAQPKKKNSEVPCQFEKGKNWPQPEKNLSTLSKKGGEGNSTISRGKRSVAKVLEVACACKNPLH